MTPLEPRQSAQLDLAFARRSDRTVLARRLYRWPFTLTRTFALDRAPAHMLTAIVQTSSGAVHGGDRLKQILHVRADAAAHVATQGASAVHRAEPGAATVETVQLRIDPGGYLEYLPEARILFPDAELVQTLEIDCAVGAVAMVADAFTVHDPEAKARSFRRFTSTTTLRLGGERPAMIDRLDIESLGHAGSGAFKAFGALILAAPGRQEAGPDLAEALNRDLAGIVGLYAAASPLPGEAAGLGVRLAGRDLRAVRAGVQAAWRSIRRRLYGALPPSRRKGDDDAAA